jgi:DNA-binding transcriptional LysR family regulator
MPKVKLEDLMIFSQVVEKKNFSKVAEHLGIVKSMISKRVSRLEADLGVRLINRSTRSMSLTESGKTLYEYTARIQDELDGAMEAIAVSYDKPRGKLKVMSPLSFGSGALSTVTGDFIQEFPDIDVQMLLSSQTSNAIEMGLDLLIHVGEPADSNMMARKIATRRLVVCASPDYFARTDTPNVPQDLVRHNCLIHTRLPESNIWRFSDRGRVDRVAIKGSFESNSSQALKYAALSGLGCVMLPDYTLRAELEDGHLVRVLSDYCPGDINIYGLYPYTKHVTPKLRAYLDYLVEHLD